MWCLRALTVGEKGSSEEAVCSYCRMATVLGHLPDVVECLLGGCKFPEVMPKRKVDHECIGDEVGDVDLECEEFAASMLDRRGIVVVVGCGLLVGRDMAFACDAGVGEVGGIVRSIWSRTSMARR